jgi:ATP-dependent Lhr-like helicase
LSGRPFTYLDDAPLEERRTRALSLRRGLGELGPDGLPVPANELAALDPEAVATVLEQICPQPRDPDELHDLLLSLVACRPFPPWADWYAALAADGRASELNGCWAATERREAATALATDDDAAAACIAGHLQLAGPVTVDELVANAPLPPGAPLGAPLSGARARTALARLEGTGIAIELPDGRWCARHLLVRLHGASRRRRRGLVEAVPIADYVRFVTHWQHATPESRLEGRAGLLEVLEQLAGIEAPAAEWEEQILPARVRDYDPRWLDELCLSGEVVWARLTPRAERSGRSGAPSPATPLTFVLRDDLVTMLRAVRGGAAAPEPEVGAAADVLAALRARGACFRPELAPVTGRLPAEVDEGLWDLVTRGLLTADAFSAVRSLLSPRDRWRTRTVHRSPSRLARRRAPVGSGIGEGRWSLLPGPEVLGAPTLSDGVLSPGNEELAEAVARQLLLRWGVVTWELWGRESFKVPWREVVWALRRMEARGLALGGRFVAGLSGEQYALPEAVEELQAVHRRARDGEQVVVAGADPLNMTGSILGGTRVPTRRHQRVVYRDGVVVDRLAAG